MAGPPTSYCTACGVRRDPADQFCRACGVALAPQHAAPSGTIRAPNATAPPVSRQILVVIGLLGTVVVAGVIAAAVSGVLTGGGLELTPSPVHCAGETRTLRIQIPGWATPDTRIRVEIVDLDAGTPLMSDDGVLHDLVNEFSDDGSLGFLATSTNDALECRLPNGHYELVVYEAGTDRLLARGDFRVDR